MIFNLELTQLEYSPPSWFYRSEKWGIKYKAVASMSLRLVFNRKSVVLSTPLSEERLEPASLGGEHRGTKTPNISPRAQPPTRDFIILQSGAGLFLFYFNFVIPVIKKKKKVLTQ